jgi:predicted GNAT superfamily acetyltransferase
MLILPFSCTVPKRYGSSLPHEQQREKSQSPYQKTADTADTTDNSGIRFTGGDGSSMENALIIRGTKNEIEGVPAEIDYISKKHGERDKSWKMVMESNFLKNGIPYVEYQIRDYKTNSTIEYYFDNTAFYSAFLGTAGPTVTPTPQQQQKETPLPQEAAVEKTDTSGIRFIGGDGSSMENALVIRGARDENEGLTAEINYISRKHGERDKYWKMLLRSNFRKNGIPYVEYRIEDYRTGSKIEYYFDNTALLGK